MQLHGHNYTAWMTVCVSSVLIPFLHVVQFTIPSTAGSATAQGQHYKQMLALTNLDHSVNGERSFYGDFLDPLAPSS